MIGRTFDTELINSYLADDPAFFKVKNPEQFPGVYFLHAWGVGMFVGVYKDHVMRMHAKVTPGMRGKLAVKAAKEVIDWVFCNTPAQKIQTRADKTKRHLMMFNGLILERCGDDEKYAYYEVSR